MSIHVAALQRAAEILGGREALAKYLEVPPAMLELWLECHLPLPADVFLRAIDVVVDHGVSEMRRHPFAARPPRPERLH